MPREVLQGTLDLMVLRTLETTGPHHGFGLAKRILQVSGGILDLNQGTLYPALLRLEQRRWIKLTSSSTLNCGITSKRSRLNIWRAGGRRKRPGSPPHATWAASSRRKRPIAISMAYVAQIRTLGDLYHKSLARVSFALVMLALAGAIGLLLGCIGIYINDPWTRRPSYA